MGKKIARCATDVHLGWVIFCPACKSGHLFGTNKTNKRPCWEFKGTVYSPTFMPSMLVTWEGNGKKRICHSYVKDGKIQFLPDCTHAMKGQTVELPDFPFGQYHVPDRKGS